MVRAAGLAAGLAAGVAARLPAGRCFWYDRWWCTAGMAAEEAAGGLPRVAAAVLLSGLVESGELLGEAPGELLTRVLAWLSARRRGPCAARGGVH